MSTFFIRDNGSLLISQLVTPGSSIVGSNSQNMSRRVVLRRVSVSILRVNDRAPISELFYAPPGMRRDSATSVHRSSGASIAVASSTFGMGENASATDVGDMLASMEMSVTAAPEMLTSLARSQSSVKSGSEAAMPLKSRKGKRAHRVSSRGAKAGPDQPGGRVVSESMSPRVEDLAEAASEVIGCGADRGGGW